MKIQNTKQEFTLKNEHIDMISDNVCDFMENIEADTKTLLRTRLTIEEALLRYQMQCGEDAKCILHSGKTFGRPFISLSVKGDAYNPFETSDDEQEDDEFGYYSDHLLEKMGLAPIYSREGKYNRFTFKFKKPKMHPILALLIAVVAAIATGFLGNMLPDATVAMLTEGVVTPICDTFFNMLNLLAGPIMFLSVVWGIYGIGDTAAFGRIGKKMIFHFLGGLTVISAVTCGILLLVFNLRFSMDAGGGSQMAAVLELLLSFFPTNIFSPFIDGNFLQVVLMAFVTGITLLVLNRQTTVIANAVEQLNSIFQYVMEFVGGVIPAFVYVILLQMIWSGTLSTAASALKPVMAIVLSGALIAMIMVLVTSAMYRVSPVLIVKKTMQTFIIAAATASSAAAFMNCVTTCEKHLGIDGKIPKFGVPIGISFYPISTTLTYLIIGLYMAEVYAVECSPVWLLLIVFMSVVLTVATPPVPGGALACYAIMFLQLGIPEEALGVALAIDTLLDFVITGINMYCLQFELLFQARGMKLVNADILRKKLK